MNCREAPTSRFHRPNYALLCWLLCLSPFFQGGTAWGLEIEVYYSPEDAPLNRLINLYENAKRYIFVSVYGLTAPPVVVALAAAKKRGVDVRLITDRERALEPKQRSAMRTLHLAGIPIMVGQHDGLMHVKQAVIDDEVNISGSMNHTTSGNRYNDERMDVLRDHATTVKAREKFLSMWADHKRYRVWNDD